MVVFEHINGAIYINHDEGCRDGKMEGTISSHTVEMTKSSSLGNGMFGITGFSETYMFSTEFLIATLSAMGHSEHVLMQQLKRNLASEDYSFTYHWS